VRFRLEIPAGVNTDNTAATYPGTWFDVNNCRFWKGKAQTVGGWESVTTDTLSGVCRTMLQWTDNSYALNIAFGQHNALSLYQSGTMYDLTPTSDFTAGQIDGTGGAGYGTGTYSTGDYSEPSTAAFFPLTWSLANYGQSLMANPRGQTIFWWQNDTGVVAAKLTNAPAEVTYMLVTPTRQIMALGCTMAGGSTFNPLAIRVSDVEDPTDWTPSTTNLSDQIILEGGGRIVGADLVSDYVFCWTNSALHVGRYTGDEGQPWVFERVGDNCGLAGPNAKCVVGQTAYWFSTTGRFYTCQLGGPPTSFSFSVGDEMENNLAPSQNDKIICSSVSKFGEVWWFYADERDGYEISRYVALSLADGAASKGTIARTAFCDTGTAFDQYPLGVTYGGNIYYHEKGQTADGGSITWSRSTSNFVLTEEQNLMMVRGFWPDLKDQVGAVNVTIETGAYPQSTMTSNGPYIVSAGDEKHDLRATGRAVRLTFSGSSTPAFNRDGVFTFDVVKAGDR
jgi:hypothetical protein